jgi:hypothetical protein
LSKVEKNYGFEIESRINLFLKSSYNEIMWSNRPLAAVTITIFYSVTVIILWFVYKLLTSNTEFDIGQAFYESQASFTPPVNQSQVTITSQDITPYKFNDIG